MAAFLCVCFTRFRGEHVWAGIPPVYRLRVKLTQPKDPRPGLEFRNNSGYVLLFFVPINGYHRTFNKAHGVGCQMKDVWQVLMEEA